MSMFPLITANVCLSLATATSMFIQILSETRQKDSKVRLAEECSHANNNNNRSLLMHKSAIQRIVVKPSAKNPNGTQAVTIQEM